MSSQPTLLFDLDGTLIDSVADLTTALNCLRGEFDLPPLSVVEVTGMVGDGARKLVQRAMPADCQPVDSVSRFLAHYHQHLCDQTTPYPGISELLHEFAGIEGCAGAHLMVPHGEEACARVIRESGLLELRKQPG